MKLKDVFSKDLELFVERIFEKQGLIAVAKGFVRALLDKEVFFI
ncbi:MAG: hypothetical protein ACQ9MH_12560 [Nitrospinales bacterium]